MPTIKLEHDFDPNLKLTNLTRYAQTYLDEITTPPRFDTGAVGTPAGTILPGGLPPNSGTMTRKCVVAARSIPSMATRPN